MMVLKWFCISISLVLLGFGIRYLWISLHFTKKHTDRTTGYLSKTEYLKNVIRGRSLHKNWVEYSYFYRVNGKPYTFSDARDGTPGTVAQSVTIAYQRKKPQYAFIQDSQLPRQPFVAAFLLISGGFVLFIGLLI